MSGLLRAYTSIKSTILSIGELNSPTITGQMVPIIGHENIMIKNNAGGFTYEVEDKDLLLRILILGTNGNTYYASSQKLTDDAINSVKKMIADGNGEMVINTLKDVYLSNRAPKMDSLFFILAMLTNSPDFTIVPKDIKSKAYEIIPEIRTFSQLYTLEGIRKSFGKKGFGRGARNAFFKYINKLSGKQFAYQATKYVSRKIGDESWSIKDIITCAHIPSKKLSLESQIVLTYIVKGIEKMEEFYKSIDDSKKTDNITYVTEYIRAVEDTKSETCTPEKAIELITKYKLPREVLNTKLLNNNDVWNSLLYVKTDDKIKITMPITALLRNLGVMSNRGLFESNEELVDAIVDHIKNINVLKFGMIHPVAILIAMSTYKMGRGLKGSLTWKINNKIAQGLEDAFYIAFGIVEGTGKRILHALDCSGSMGSPMPCLPQLSSCQAVSTLVMEAIKRESVYSEKTGVQFVQDVMIFDKKGSIVNINSTDRLDNVIKKVQDYNFGTTDCAQPMIKALEMFKESKGEKGLYDAFIVYTDNETYAGKIHPSEALDNYNKETGLTAKLIVVATTPTSYSISEANILTDNKMNPRLTLNIAGFDLNAPDLIRNFINGTSYEQVIVDSVDSVDSVDYDIVELNE